MALCPFAIQKLITIDSAGRAHTPVRMTEHTAVSSAVDLYKGRPAPNGTYAHFYVNEFGTIYQYRDTALAARADGQGNFGSLSVETWDGAREQAWNKAQVAALARLFAWARSVHPTIPNRLATVNDLRGLAWHRLGCKGNFGAYDPDNITTWSGNQSGAVWSTARGKTCPYDVRIRQIPGILAASNNAKATIDSPKEEDDMTPEQAAIQGKMFYAIDKLILPALTRMEKRTAVAEQNTAVMRGLVEAQGKAITQLKGGGDIDMAALKDAAERGAREGAASVGAAEVADLLEIRKIDS